MTEKWNADITSIDNSTKIENNLFEESRRCLLTVYHSYVQNHAGYLITLGIGFLVLVSSFESFYRNNYDKCVFWGFMIALVVLLAFCFLRMFYWTTYTNLTIGISQKYACEVFNKQQNDPENKHGYPISEKAPYTVILQTAIDKALRTNANNKDLPILYRIGLKLILLKFNRNLLRIKLVKVKK